ncbi:MAG: CBS domain-containing protein, partial [bacterium]
IMIFEVTRDYTIIVPLMIANLIAFYISQRLQKEPIYEALAHQDGIHLPTGSFRIHTRRLGVSVAQRSAPTPIDSGLDVAAAALIVAAGSLSSWPVTNSRGLLGMVRESDLAMALAAGRETQTMDELLRVVAAEDAAGDTEDDVAHVHPDQPLGQALVRMGETRHNVLPVVSRADIRMLVGIVTLEDILASYGVGDMRDLPDEELARNG